MFRSTQPPRTCLLMLAVLLPALALPAGAFAAPGDHIRVGEATITPSVKTALEYRSNTYKADGCDVGVPADSCSPEVASANWALQPRFQLDLNGRLVIVDFGAGWGLRKFIDLDANDGFFPENADRFSDFDARLSLNGLPKSKVGFKLDNKFESRGFAAEMPTAVGTTSNIVHTGNDLTGGIAYRPGSALEFTGLGLLGVDYYTVPIQLVTNDNPNYNNRVQYGPVVNGSWRFLPKTSLVSSFSYTFLRWDKNLVEALGPEAEGSDIGAYVGKPDADSWRFTTGVTGQFTPKLAASASVGFGQMMYDEQSVIDGAGSVPDSSTELNTTGDETFATDTSIGDGLLFRAQASYAPVRGHTFMGGYQKDFQDAIFTNYVAYHYFFLRYEGSIQNRLTLSGELGYRIDNFHGEISRDDQNVNIKGGVAYKITPYLDAAAGLSWEQRACLVDDCEGVFYSTQYDNFTASLGATFTY